MRSPIRAPLLILLGLGLQASAAPSWSAEGCAGYSWDVSRELALFASKPESVAAGDDSASTAKLVPGKLYALRLWPASQVKFVAAPGRARAVEGAMAGLATLEIAAPGRYRIAVDIPFWIDVVADGGLMQVQDFQGVADCSAPRKIIEFDFPVARTVTLQFSGAANPTVRIAVTAAKPAP